MSIDNATPEEWDALKRGYATRAPALDIQVGGDHYKHQKLQPLEMVYLRYGYEGVKAALHCKIDKYLTRQKGEPRENLSKAQHCIDLLIEFYDKEVIENGQSE